MTTGLVENQQLDRLFVLPDRSNENALVTNCATVAPWSACGRLWQREAALSDLPDSQTSDRLMVIERDGRDCGG